MKEKIIDSANDYASAYYDWDDEVERKEVVSTFLAGYRQAMYDFKKEIEKRIQEKDWALRELSCNEEERGQTHAQKISLSSILDFIESLDK